MVNDNILMMTYLRNLHNILLQLHNDMFLFRILHKGYDFILKYNVKRFKYLD